MLQINRVVTCGVNILGYQKPGFVQCVEHFKKTEAMNLYWKNIIVFELISGKATYVYLNLI